MFVFVITKGVTLGLPISLIALVLVLIGMRFGDELWLKVRIDGKKGWIHTQEDFVAIGLPPAG